MHVRIFQDYDVITPLENILVYSSNFVGKSFHYLCHLTRRQKASLIYA